MENAIGVKLGILVVVVVYLQKGLNNEIKFKNTMGSILLEKEKDIVNLPIKCDQGYIFPPP
jgi:hypothetical protein